MAELDRAGIVYTREDPKLARLVEELKEREATGYAYESANASFDLLARRTLGLTPTLHRVLYAGNAAPAGPIDRRNGNVTLMIGAV